MAGRAPVFVLGDIHGQIDRMRGLLREAELLDQADHWAGGTARLWFIGDYFDRGPDGRGVITMIRRLQSEAAATGGTVGALLGNHEPLLLGARYFPDVEIGYRNWTFREVWQRNGGMEDDLAHLTADEIAWIVALPAMALVDQTLLIHADSLLYLTYGSTIAAVNQQFGAVLSGQNKAAWSRLLGQFSERTAFAEQRPDGLANLQRFFATYGGQQLVHGHTPIPRLLDCDPATVTMPYRYANGRCVNVDGGLYLGGPGFVYRLPSMASA